MFPSPIIKVMPNETHKAESAEVIVARSYVAESLVRCMAEMDNGAFVSAPSGDYEKGELTQSSIQAAISRVGEAGLEHFDTIVAPKEGRLGDLIIFERVLEDGTFVQVQSESPTIANTDEVIARSIFISFKSGGKTLEIPNIALHLINTEWRSGDCRITSLLDYRVHTFTPGTARTPDNMKVAKLRMVNPSVVWYDQGHDEIEDSKTPRLRIIESDKVPNNNAEFAMEIYDLLQEAWPESSVIVATPNIPLAQLGALRTELTRNANGDNLDLDAIIFTSIQDGRDKEGDRWRLGWDDGHTLFVHVYPKEFFDSDPNARHIFDTQIVPEVLAKYDL